jgi:predicted amidohydrolase
MTETLALAAVQLRLGADDFASESAFGRCIERAADSAAQACAGADHRLLVFPESIGHFIPLIHAPALIKRQVQHQAGRAAQARSQARSQATSRATPVMTVDRAMAALALSRPVPVLRSMWRAGTLDVSRAVLLAFMPAADRLMRQVFSAVARRHRAFVVAGSHLRPAAGARVVTNTSYTFDPHGRVVATTHKVNLVPGLEDDSPGGLGLARGDAWRLPVVDAPWGRLATLICYDGFRLPHTPRERFVCVGARADALGVDVIANPAANPWPWNQRWVFAPPGSQRLRREQWREEGLPATLRGLGRVRYGVTAHLCAEIFDLRFEGKSQIVARTGANSDIQVLGEATDEAAADVVVARVAVPMANAADAHGVRENMPRSRAECL